MDSSVAMPLPCKDENRPPPIRRILKKTLFLHRISSKEKENIPPHFFYKILDALSC
jgi:hypothetical protein